MTYNHITLRKNNNGNWETATSPVSSSYFAVNGTLKSFEDRHGYIQGLGWSGNHDIESVTKLRKGGDMKNTEKFDFFFDYTYAPDSMHSIRFREAISQVK